MSDMSESFEGPLGGLGELLKDRGHRYELLAIGGGALQLLGLITRPTRDIDVIGLVADADVISMATLPGPLQQAVEDTATVFRLPTTWFNAGPRSLTDLGLPEGILERAHRRDQIFFKLYAAVDQGPRSKHFDDLQRLKPSSAELRDAAAWARSHDPSEAFNTELQGALRDLGITDGNV